MNTTAHELADALFELIKAENEVHTVPESHWAQEAMARYESAVLASVAERWALDRVVGGR
jgi:hypothetical protein